MFADLEAQSVKERQQSAALALAVHSQETTKLSEMDSVIDCLCNQFSAFSNGLAFQRWVVGLCCKC